jgi:hypothetical protein
MIKKYGQEAYNNINWQLLQKICIKILQVLISDQNDKFIGTNKKPIIQTAKVHHAKMSALWAESGNDPTRTNLQRKARKFQE